MAKTKDLVDQLNDEIQLKRVELAAIEEKRNTAKLAQLMIEEEKLLPLVCKTHDLFTI